MDTGELAGRIYSKPGFSDGEHITSSAISTKESEFVVTASGSLYKIGREAALMDEWLFLETGQLAGRIYGKAGGALDLVDGDMFISSAVPIAGQHTGYVVTSSGSIYRQGRKAASLEEWRCNEGTWQFSGNVYGSHHGLADGTEHTTSHVSSANRYDGFICTANLNIYKLGQPADGQHNAQPDPKLAASELTLGRVEEATLGLREMVGLDDEQLAKALKEGVEGIAREFENHGEKHDRENLHYVLHGVACDEDYLPSQVKADIANGSYHGGKLVAGEYDAGHAGMRLEHFLQLEPAQQSRLTLPEILALRLYTTSSFRCFNNPLRRREKPHPFAFGVYHLAEGIRKLRTVVAMNSASAMQKTEWLYRGMRNLRLPDNFARVGGCELAPMSTSTSLEVARSYSKSVCPLVFQYRLMGIGRGASLQFLSVYPKEHAFLFPPLTFLSTAGAEPSKMDDGMTVMTVTPILS